MFRALLKEQEDLAWAPDPHAVLEMAVVRLATMAPGADVEMLLTRLDALEAQLRGGGGTPPAGPGRGGSGSTGSRETRAGANRSSSGRGRGKNPSTQRSEPAAPHGSDAGTAPSDVAPPTASDAPAPRGASEDGDAASAFEKVCAFVLQENRGLGAALQAGQATLCRAGEVHVAVEEAFAAHRLERRRSDLEALFTRFFGTPTRFAVRGPEAPSPDAAEDDGAREQVAQQRRAALDHPAVNRSLEILGGEVISIRTLGDPQ